jgi:hypothetical protein
MLLPRFIRLRDAPGYLGMDRNRFNAEVRPWLTEIAIGIQGIAFDRLDLDRFAEEYKQRNGRVPEKGVSLWRVPEPPASKQMPTGARSSTSGCSGCGSSDASARSIRTRLKPGLRGKLRSCGKPTYSDNVLKELSAKLQSGT